MLAESTPAVVAGMLVLKHALQCLQEQLAQHVRSSDAKQLKTWLRDIMQQASGLPVRSSALSRQKAMAASSTNGAMLS